ncbi:sigma 54-interacting transcriptional regulator [Alicyclobacillus cycloheptanicus]|uniref:sigma 54-interacting transcriptional regulator n=1 Tax=Alicyclobacillus cycloheptanicus TaxID=1457 RepID=UPI00237803DD|nr:sigma 54-interacting transcriptional regulator [Alicyclobacillus cycloheptanicus]WDM00134.1 sigma 54-interacting transcriptional regulator [Alicyclobacillus cycloheptanicus]
MFLKVVETAKRAAQTDFTVTILGESGTGKDLLSLAIHYASNRANAPFVAINCGAITKSLMESESRDHPFNGWLDFRPIRA